MNTTLVGLIGHPIRQTLSPFIHNVAFDIKKLDYLYLPFDVPAANLSSAVKGMVALGMQLLNNVSEEAAGVGAVNTVVNDMGRLSGHNTDVYGILESLEEYKDDLTGKTVTVIGAGGSARAVIYTLIKYFRPESVNIVNRTLQKADSLMRYFSEKMKFDQINCYELFPENENIYKCYSGGNVS